MNIEFSFGVPVFANPGQSITPGCSELETVAVLDMARKAEELGYDALWVPDHLMLGKDDAILEGWSVLAALAGSTTRVRLGLLHQSNPFRHPALVAKMVATLDQISGGRLIYYPDMGNQVREHQAYGMPWSDDQAERIARMVEGLELTLELWSASEPVTFKGRYYQTSAAVCQPAPLQQPHPPIWMGEVHPDTLAACARYGQGWHSTPVSLPVLAQRLQALDEACLAVGRPMADLQKAMATQVLVAEDRDTLRRRYRDIFSLAATEDIPHKLNPAWLIGTPDEVEEKIRAYAEAGIGHFLLWFMDAPREEGLRLFAEEVAPRFRR
ncbi:MAG: alkanesulfonate monooxygenase SsuD [Candidatus Latescibacterota bacterium]|jgi:alkanesulfonate monooxygenase SsuD/methylene tetrahydromethanopterin reductase-like flavin-dependent oxidoreductase (luciferase family)